MWKDGHSASQIANELGYPFTRNAVIGKIHRLGLGTKSLTPEQRALRSTRPRSDRPRGTRRPRRAAKNGDGTALAFEPYVPPPEPPPPNPQYLCTLDDLGPIITSDPKLMKCRAPVGEPGTDEFRFCGTPESTLPGPYCAFHHRLYYQVGTAMGRRGRLPNNEGSGETEMARAPALEYTELALNYVPSMVDHA